MSHHHHRAGKFIAFEGGEGTGKSTQARMLANALEARGIHCTVTREPGGTPLGEALRAIVLNETMHAETEALLVFASRREHIAAVIAPALARRAVVISDRFTDATYAYQCGGRGLDAERVGALETWVHKDLQPDLTFLFDAPIDVARERLDKNTVAQDKFERERGDFFNRVRVGYMARVAAFPARFAVIDSSQNFAQIQAEISAKLTQYLALNSARRSPILGHLQ